MAAGLGFKDFTTGEVLTAADVDGYLMQGIWVFASNAARDAAVTAPAEGNFAFTKDTNSLWYYDGAAWVASGATGDIEGVTAGTGISGGGTSGTVTITNSMATAITTAGDTLYGTGSGTFSRLGIGTAGQVLQVNSGATAPEWAAPAGGGKVLQVVSGTYATQTIIASTSYTDTGLSLSITPTSATSKVLVLVTQNAGASRAVANIGYFTQLVRGATSLQELDNKDLDSTDFQSSISFSYLDSPATTSSTTYKTQGKCTTTANSASAFYQLSNIVTSSIILLEIGA